MTGKKKAVCALIIFFALIAAILAGLALWQRDNISAALYGLQHETADIENEIAQVDSEMDEAVSEYDIPDTSLSDETAEGIVNGTLDVNSLVDELIKKHSESESQAASGGSSGSSDTDAEVQRLITKLYVLRGSYTSRLDSLIGAAKSEFYALPESQRTDTARRRIISEKISQGSAMEGACDAQVSSIVSQIRSTLSSAGRSTAIADQIMSAYAREKQLKKSYYMSLV